MKRTSLAIVAAALLLATAVASTSAQRVVPATSASSSSKGSSKHGGCSSIAGCRTCSKSGCTACKTGADLVGGRCNCPAGSGQYGTANTVPVVTSNGRKLSQVAAASSTKPAHGSKGKGGGKGGSGGGGGGGGGSGGASSFACAACAANTYAATSKVVSSARCAACPDGTTSPEGANTCFVDPGFYYDSASGTVKQCAANKYCLGGDFQAAGRVQTNCPSGTSSPVQSSELGACTVPAGSYYDEISGKIIKCPVGSYCPGGSVTGDGAGKTSCPEGATTAAIGASAIGQCTVPPGSYYDEDTNTIRKCPINTYCPGGSIEGGGASPVQCPDGTSFPATGGSALNDCIVPAGSYWDPTAQPAPGAIAQCPANKYCEGGPIGTTGKIISNCPASTTSPAGSDAIADCVVAPGSYYDSVSGTVKQCPAGSWCPGGSLTGAGATKPACPANTDSVAGSDAEADCTLNAGYYCLYTGTTCAVTQCTINQYCPGGVSVTDTTDNGSRNCPTGSVSVAGSDAVADCKIPAGSYCAAYTNSVCSTISPCLANKYCPGGSSVTDPANNGQKNCPANTVSAAGSDAKADCELAPGYFCVYDAIEVCTVTPCAAGFYCPGGASIEDPTTPGNTKCPAGTSSPAGSNAADDCVVAPGYYYDGTSVVICPANKYCEGGPISGAGSVANACPGTSVSAAGSDAVGDCKLPAGSYCVYTSNVCTITTCAANNYCPGGDSLDDPTNTGLKACPANTESVAGSDAKGDCTLKPGYYCVYDSNQSCTVSKCPVGSFCPGGSSITNPASPGDNDCPAGSTSPAGATSQNDCVVPAGKYFDGTNIVDCPVNAYCPGGPISGAGGNPPTPCPPNTSTATLTGQTSKAACVLDAGYYCVYSGTTCAVTPCAVRSYCPGGASITDTANTGAVACPADTYSSGGATATSKAACTLDLGFYCTYAQGSTDCIVTLCDPLYYCPGLNPITAPGPYGGRTDCPTATDLSCGAGCTVTSLPGSFKVVQCTCSCAAPANVCDGIGQVYSQAASACVCDIGYYASGATGPLYCLSCESAYQPTTVSVPYLSTSAIGATSKTQCNTCTYGYTFTAGTPPTCTQYCDTIVLNSNSTAPGPTVPADCNTCAIGYYIVPGAGGNADNVLDPSLGETCAACPTPPGTGYGTGLLATCTSTCKQDEWFDTTTGKCATCPAGRYTDPSLPLVTSASTDGVAVCLCPPGYYSNGAYNLASTICIACLQPGDPNAIIRTVPKYGATSSSACQIGCAPGFYVKSSTTCFKCQQTTSWSPGSLVDPAGPLSCYSCTGTGYIGARLMADGSYKCNETGQFGNSACIPCKQCATGTIPGGYSCPA